MIQGEKTEIKPMGKVRQSLIKLGRPTLNDEVGLDSLKAFQAKPITTRGELLRDKWSLVCYTLLLQAERFSRSVSKKDFGRLMQLLSSAGIAYDKVVPKGEPLGLNLTFNLFKGLPSSEVGALLGTPRIIASSEPRAISGVSD